VRELPHQDEVREVALSADGKLLASHSIRGAVCLWDAKTGKKIRSFPAHPKNDESGRIRDEDNVNGFALSADGKRLAGSFDRPQPVIRLWDVPTGKEVGTIDALDDTERQLLFSPDGKTLARACQHSLRLWDVTSGKELWHSP